MVEEGNRTGLARVLPDSPRGRQERTVEERENSYRRAA